MLVDKDNKLNKDIIGQWTLGIREKQLKWLASKALKFKEDDWSVIMVSHGGAPSDEDVTNRELVCQIIKAFNNGEKGVAKSNIEQFEANISYDFSKNKSSDFLCWLAGHNHKDTVTNDDGITVITTRNLLGDIENIQYDEDETTYGSWDCMLIDKKKRKLISKRYNLPKFDREINF